MLSATAAELQRWQGGEAMGLPRSPWGHTQAQWSGSGAGSLQRGASGCLAQENDGLRARVSELEGVLQAARAGAAAALSAVAAAALPLPAARGSAQAAQ